ncbi:MAG: c-type cytochrome [Rhodobiaceae bacterium]|nr:c-type cytochrome [Rhodobiaceae bacterium]
MRVSVLALAMGLAAVGPLGAAEYGDAAEGELLAKTWCANCHVVEAEPSQADSLQAPTFKALAAQPDMSVERLTIIFANPPHPAMDGISPSRQQIADIAAYLETLKD